MTMDIVLVVVVSLGVYVLLHLHKEPAATPIPTPTPNVVLIDGEIVPGFGTYHESLIENGIQSYASSALGVAFDYPSDYLLFAWGAGVSGADAYETIMLSPATSTLAAIRYIRDGGRRGRPASIGLVFFPKPSTGYAAIPAWLVTHMNMTNFDPASVPAIVLTTTTVAGFPAYAYQMFGMFTFNYRAFIAGDCLVLAWAEDDTDKDFGPILQSLRFAKPVDVSFVKAATRLSEGNSI